MNSGVGVSRVSIPNYARKTIQNIREITGKQHSDDEIYAVLKECSMDPNETAQKLFYLDTFHEVKKRRDRRKENFNSRGPDESRLGTGVQRRTARGGGQDVAGGRSSGRREHGANNIKERDSMSSSLKVSPKSKIGAASHITISTGMPNGTTNLSNGSSSCVNAPKSFSGSDGCLADVLKLGVIATQSAVVAASHTFDSLGNKQEKSLLKTDQLSTSATPTCASSVAESGMAPSPWIRSVGVSSTVGEGSQQRVEPNHTHGNVTISKSIDMELNNEKAVPMAASYMHDKKSPSKSKTYERNELPENFQLSSLLSYEGKFVGRPLNADGQSPLDSLAHCKETVVTSEVVGITVGAHSQSPPQSNVFDDQHVTFPNHFQVLETIKNGLTFGSFDATFGLKMDAFIVDDDDSNADQSSQDNGESFREPSGDKNTSSSSDGVSLDHSQCLPHALEDPSSSEGNAPASTVLKTEPLKQEIQLPREGSQNPPVANDSNYSIGIVPSMVGSLLVSFDGHEHQAHENRVPNSSSVNSQTQSPASLASPAPRSIPLSPHSYPLFRQTYPHNFFPYSQYISPIYMPPIHQFLGHNGFPPQPSNGNMFLPPSAAAAAAAGIKYSLPQFKPGTNVGNPTYVGIQSGSSFITTPVGYAPASAVLSGSSMDNEDIVASQLKESQIYTTGQLTEGSTVWHHAPPGQDIPSLPVNSLYHHLPPHGQHITFSPAQAAHGAFAGIYPSGHTITAPSTLLQHSQAMTGAVETVGPLPGAY